MSLFISGCRDEYVLFIAAESTHQRWTASRRVIRRQRSENRQTQKRFDFIRGPERRVHLIDGQGEDDTEQDRK